MIQDVNTRLYSKLHSHYLQIFNTQSNSWSSLCEIRQNTENSARNVVEYNPDIPDNSEAFFILTPHSPLRSPHQRQNYFQVSCSYTMLSFILHLSCHCYLLLYILFHSSRLKGAFLPHLYSLLHSQISS